jgi:hypothetical protein
MRTLMVHLLTCPLAISVIAAIGNQATLYVLYALRENANVQILDENKSLPNRIKDLGGTFVIASDRSNKPIVKVEFSTCKDLTDSDVLFLQELVVYRSWSDPDYGFWVGFCREAKASPVVEP